MVFQNFLKHLASRYVKGVPFLCKLYERGTISIWRAYKRGTFCCQKC